MPLDAAGGPDERIEKLRKRYDTLKGSTERANCESHWQEIAEVIAPRKLDFVGMRTPGEKRMNKIYDPTGVQALDMLAAGLHGMATNPSSKWFSLRLISEKVQDPQTGEIVKLDDVSEVQSYLNEVEDIMWERMYAPGTNFTTALHECYLDIGSFGTAVLYCGQRDDGELLFECRPLAETVVAENADGKVDTVFRCFEYTVRQVWQMQNLEGWKVSDKTREKYEQQKYDEKVKIIHAVYPRESREPGREDPENKKYASCYFEHEAMHCLAESGFDELPYQVARWSKYSGEVYGRGPGQTALPDVKMLQAMVLAKIKLIHKAADPPMWLSNDSIVGQTRTVPGGVNYMRGNPNERVMLQPVSLQGIQALAEDIGQLREQILRSFYADLMRMTDRANMTATEVVQRTQEMMRLFGPLIGRLESELLGPLIERIFGIMMRQQLLPPPPQILQGKSFGVQFVSPVATAQKQSHYQGLVQAAQLMVAAVGEEAALMLAQRNVNGDELFRSIWHGFNNDPDVLKSEEELAEADQMQQAQMQAQMAGQMMQPVQQGAGAMKDLAQANQAMGPAEGGPGLDPSALLGQFAAEVENNPQAQEEMRDLAERGLSQVGAEALVEE
jgi:hypothetical protein